MSLPDGWALQTEGRSYGLALVLASAGDMRRLLAPSAASPHLQLLPASLRARRVPLLAGPPGGSARAGSNPSRECLQDLSSLLSLFYSCRDKQGEKAEFLL